MIQQGVVRLCETVETSCGLEPVKLDYRVMVDLVAKLPKLEYWDCRIDGDEWESKWQLESTGYLTRD